MNDSINYLSNKYQMLGPNNVENANKNDNKLHGIPTTSNKKRLNRTKSQAPKHTITFHIIDLHGKAAYNP